MLYGQPWQFIEGFSYQQIDQWELLHNSRDFSTNISNLFFKVAKVSIQKVIGFGWVWLRKRKLCGRTLKAYQVWDKPNLDNIFKSYLSYCDMEGLHNHLIILKGCKKIYLQLSLPTFFVIFTFAQRLWDPIIKVLHTLHA